MTLDDCKEEASFGGQQTDLISKTKENQLIPNIVTIFEQIPCIQYAETSLTKIEQEIFGQDF